MTTEKQTNEAPPLLIAATSCPHEIDHGRVILHFDPKQPGHNALNQLGRRLDAALASAQAQTDLEATSNQPTNGLQADALRIESLMREWIEAIKQAHDESLDGTHASARKILRDVIEEMSAAPPVQQEPTGDAKAVLAALVSAQCSIAASRPPGSSNPDSAGYDHDAFMWDYYQRAIEAARRLCAAPPVQQGPMGREGCNYVCMPGKVCRKCGHVHDIPLTVPPVQQAEPLNDMRIHLVTLIHGLCSQIENTLYALRSDDAAVRQARGAIAYALKESAQYNYNGRPLASAQVQQDDAPGPTPGYPKTSRDWLEALIDIWDDEEKNAPEHRCYIPGALGSSIEEARKHLAAPPVQQADTWSGDPSVQDYASTQPERAGVVPDAVREALEHAGQFIAWTQFGDCRAYGPGPIPSAAEVDAEIRSALNAAPPAPAAEKRDREADRQRFVDLDFNRWLDESITENGEFTVWHSLKSTQDAYAGWQCRLSYAPHPMSRVEFTSWPAIHEKREPLTKGQIDAILHERHFDPSYQTTRSDRNIIAWWKIGIRDAERAHGIAPDDAKEDGK